MFQKAPSVFASAMLVVLMAAASCYSPSRRAAPDVTTEPEVPEITDSVWSGLLKQTPYPYTTPLPPSRVSVLDGTYVQYVPSQTAQAPDSHATPTPPGGGVWMWHPVRPTVWVMPPGPYSVAGSGWVLHLDRGIFRVLHPATGWHTLGSYTVSESHIVFFNDPHCMKSVGVYGWQLTDGLLRLAPATDECGAQTPFQSGAGGRARMLTSLPWVAGRPP